MRKQVKNDEKYMKSLGFDVNTNSQIIYTLYSSIMCFAPIMVFSKIYIDVSTFQIIPFCILSTVATYILIKSYKNFKHKLKHDMLTNKSNELESYAMEYILKGVKAQLSKVDLQERLLNYKNATAEKESFNFSIFYVNALYFVVFVFFAFYVFSMLTSPIVTFGLSQICSTMLIYIVTNKS
ncbi:SSR-gamma [Intoshia linei]|uniref:Translocon-associated protein subunit gamma n=1 Tax=Intoshia linei TaxID=1819745 RepID=A0A177B955_9BILA|nr:SSR-gamma [Intoshia linei]